jgi:hypothetical protein
MKSCSAHHFLKVCSNELGQISWSFAEVEIRFRQLTFSAEALVRIHLIG